MRRFCSVFLSQFDARRLRRRQVAQKHDANLPTSAFSGRTLQGESGRPSEISRSTGETNLGESLRNQRSALHIDDAWRGADVARTTSAADLAGLLLVVADLRTVPLRLTDRLKVADNRKAGDLRSGRVRGRETSTQHRTTTRQVRGRETSAQRPTYAQRVNYCCSFVNWRMPDFARSSMAFRAS